MTRLAIPTHAPEGYKAVAALDLYLHQNIDHQLVDLVKLRASQLNGCAYCVDMHATDLEKAGVPARKIYGTSAWRETSFYTDKERAALALTEEVTFIADGGVSDEVWAEASALYTERELSDLILLIGTINLWNRIGVSTHLSPPALHS